MFSPAKHYEYSELERQGAWEPPDGSGPLPVGEGEAPKFSFFNGKLKLGFDCVFSVDFHGKSGGLALFWKSDFLVSIQNYSRWHINAVVGTGGSDFCWKFSASMVIRMLAGGRSPGHC
jgi:hypothetical protein